jgi:hypothetical protein
MLSESARAASAAEARYRIAAPNSRPRAVKVIALDAESEAIIKRLAETPWRGATFLTLLRDPPRTDQTFSMAGWLRDLAGHTKGLLDEIAGADNVVMIAHAGSAPEGASIVGEACSLKRIMTTGLIVSAPATPDEVLARTLAHLRPWALMLVIASAEEYIADMLAALRA